VYRERRLKKFINFLRKKECTPEKILATPMFSSKAAVSIFYELCGSVQCLCCVSFVFMSKINDDDDDDDDDEQTR